VRTSHIVVVVGVLLLTLSLLVSAAKPEILARGELRGPLYLAGQSLELQIAFNVHGRGDQGDIGSISIRVFDQTTGKLLGVMVSSAIRYVEIMGDGGVYFQARLRFVAGVEPTGPEWWFFRAYDDPDRFFLLGPEIPIDRGKVFVRY
jgi:hypothetical protein